MQELDQVKVEQELRRVEDNTSGEWQKTWALLKIVDGWQ